MTFMIEIAVEADTKEKAVAAIERELGICRSAGWPTHSVAKGGGGGGAYRLFIGPKPPTTEERLRLIEKEIAELRATK